MRHVGASWRNVQSGFVGCGLNSWLKRFAIFFGCTIGRFSICMGRLYGSLGQLPDSAFTVDQSLADPPLWSTVVGKSTHFLFCLLVQNVWCFWSFRVCVSHPYDFVAVGFVASLVLPLRWESYGVLFWCSLVGSACPLLWWHVFWRCFQLRAPFWRI